MRMKSKNRKNLEAELIVKVLMSFRDWNDLRVFDKKFSSFDKMPMSIDSFRSEFGKRCRQFGKGKEKLTSSSAEGSYLMTSLPARLR